MSLQSKTKKFLLLCSITVITSQTKNGWHCFNYTDTIDTRLSVLNPSEILFVPEEGTQYGRRIKIYRRGGFGRTALYIESPELDEKKDYPKNWCHAKISQFEKKDVGFSHSVLHHL